jgi:hypothetical protein
MVRWVRESADLEAIPNMNSNSESGFSLVELAIAAGLMSVVVLAATSITAVPIQAYNSISLSLERGGLSGQLNEAANSVPALLRSQLDRRNNRALIQYVEGTCPAPGCRADVPVDLALYSSDRTEDRPLSGLWVDPVWSGTNPVPQYFNANGDDCRRSADPEWNAQCPLQVTAQFVARCEGGAAVCRRPTVIQVKYKIDRNTTPAFIRVADATRKIDFQAIDGKGTWIEVDKLVTAPWTPTTTENAPVGRMKHSDPSQIGVWTGSKLLVWGGANAPGGNCNAHTVQAGGIYDPDADSWEAVAPWPSPFPTNATPATNPAPYRFHHSMVWTGETGNPATENRLIVWGGSNCTGWGNDLRDGAIYHPATRTWRRMSMIGAPPGRRQAVMVWTGTEVLVWGGVSGPDPGNYRMPGGIYNPETDTWRPMADSEPAVRGRVYFSYVWTGTDLIVFGGAWAGKSGGIYHYNPNPANPGTWEGINPATVPGPATRTMASAVWTGTEMIVWGGGAGYLPAYNSGLAYNPVTRTWRLLSTVNAPSARIRHVQIWTGSHMIVWGGTPNESGLLNTGGIYNPETDQWIDSTSLLKAPLPRKGAVGFWTGSKMLVWGGALNGTLNGGTNTGGLYTPPAGVAP